MARVIEYYIPDRYRRPVRWVAPENRGKVLSFPSPVKKSA